MAKKKFAKKEFKIWLDHIAKLTCKTDDNFTCQIRLSDNCSRTMMPLDNNCQWCHIKSKKSYNVRWLAEDAVTGCGSCHAYAHDNPDDFIRWFEKNYPHRANIINLYKRMPSKTWYESDFKAMERKLLVEAKRVGVDYMNMTEWHNYRLRLKRKLKELSL